MIKKAQLNLLLFARNHRLPLWILLLLLTAIILLFPTHLTPEYHPIQSLYIFGSLPLFGALFYIWLLLLLLLLFSGRSESKTDWEKMALVCISSLVFLAFWVIILPYGRFDYLANAGIVRAIQQEGVIPVGFAAYLDFPASHLMVLSLSQVTGLGIFDAANLFLVGNALIFSALLYLLFTKSFKSTSVAAFAALMVMLGNQFLARGYTFWPGIPSLVLLLAFLVMLTRGQHTFLDTWQDRLMAIILLVAATTMYFQASVLIPLILVGVYLVQRLGRMTPVAISTICLFAVIPIAWEIYWTVVTFSKLVGFLPKIVADITAGTFLDWVPFLAEANVGERFPLWANAIRLFWWGLIFGLGTILGLRNLFKVKELTLGERLETGGLLGVIILAGIATLSTLGGERFVHFLHYAAFFTVPVLLRSSLNLGRRIKGYGFTLLVILLLVLSLPTFLVFNNKIGTDAFYPYELSAGEFLKSSYGSGEGVVLINATSAQRYYLPEAATRGSIRGIAGISISEDEFWRATDDVMGNLQKATEDRLFIKSARLRGMVKSLAGISSTHPHWQIVEDVLSDNCKIYDSGRVQIFTPR